jgi:hypothetical protein
MAMALYPETMEKAQREIDAIFNMDTLPSFARMQDLPYCSALIKELLRFALPPCTIVVSSWFISLKMGACGSSINSTLLGCRRRIQGVFRMHST